MIWFACTGLDGLEFFKNFGPLFAPNHLIEELPALRVAMSSLKSCQPAPKGSSILPTTPISSSCAIHGRTRWRGG